MRGGDPVGVRRAAGRDRARSHPVRTRARRQWNRGGVAMKFDAMMGRTWNENRLFSVLIELTYRCNLDCFFCYNDLGLRGKPLSYDQYDTLLRDLASMDVLNVALSGGEPLAHPDFFRIGARARQLGFVVRVKSNGHALSGE